MGILILIMLILGFNSKRDAKTQIFHEQEVKQLLNDHQLLPEGSLQVFLTITWQGYTYWRIFFSAKILENDISPGFKPFKTAFKQ